MHHAAHHAGLGGGIKVGPWDTLESQQLLTTLRLSRWDLNHLDNSWGCGDFGLYFIPGLGQHCEFCLDGILWHIAASSELLAYVFFVSRWSPLTSGWEPGWQGKTTSVTSHGTMGPLRWSMTIYPARSLVGWISLFLCCWCLPWVLPPMPRCMHCYLASMIIQFLYRMQVHFIFIWPAGRPKPSSFRSWQAYFSMCDWLHTWGGLMFEMVLFGILRSFESGPTSMKWVTYLIDYNVAWSHLNGSCQDVGKSESSTLCRRVAWRESSAKNETFTYSYACATSFKNSKQLLENTIVHYLTNFSLDRVKVCSLKQQGLCKVPKASPVWGPEAFWILLIQPFLAVVQQMFSWKLLKLVHWWAPS